MIIQLISIYKWHEGSVDAVFITTLASVSISNILMDHMKSYQQIY